MKKNIYNKMRTVILTLGSILLVTACVTDGEPKNPKDPANTEISQELKDFGFSTRSSVRLNVNYDAPGYIAQIEIYGENPVVEGGKEKKSGIKPIYSVYTNDEGKFNGDITIPSFVSEVYLYTNRWGLPQCVKANYSAKTISFDASLPVSRSATRSAGTRAPYSYVIGDKQPYQLAGNTSADGLLALGRFDISGYMEYDGFFGSSTDYTDSYITKNVSYKGESIADLNLRTQAYYDTYKGNKTELLRPADVTNIKVKKSGSIDLVYMSERGAYLNSFGYYYYEAGAAPSEASLKTMKKYVVIPNIEDDDVNRVVKSGYTFRLKYFGKDGNEDASDIFPENTVVGWFIVSDGWDRSSGKIKSWQDGVARNYFFSNDQDQNMRFVALKDPKTGVVVLGCEDQPEYRFDREKEDYSDLLFFVKTDDGEFDDGDKPELPEEKPEYPDGDFSASGTLAFEDIWPTGGDYDMNDAALVYDRKVKFDKDNKVSMLEETFKFVHGEYAATLSSWFAYQVKSMGTPELPAECQIESETNSIVWNLNTKESYQKEFVIKRRFSGSVDPKEVLDDFNPYIMVMSQGDNRKEVHLPGHPATTKINKNLIGSGDDAYYMSKDGKYPFAIDISKLDFVLSGPSRSIDKTYPRFAKWADSMGKTDNDWYEDKPVLKD